MPDPSGKETGWDDGGLAKVPELTESFVNRTMEMIVAADPAAKVLVRLRMVTPRWWRLAHSNETVRVFDVHSGKFRQLDWGSPGSPAWREQVEVAIRRTIRLLEERWPDRVFGYHPGLVCCAENAYDWGGGIADFSPANLRGFKGRVPDPEVFVARRLYDTRRLLDPVAHADAIAFLRYQAEAMADGVCWLSHVVKDELAKLGRTKICGAFYGYMNLPQNQTDLFSSGHTAHAAVLASPDIDFIAAPIDYSARQPGGVSLPQALPGSIAANGKLYWAEEDSRYHRAQGHVAHCVSHDVETTRHLLLRNFLDAYSHGGAIWWMDLFGEGWYREPFFTEAVGACRAFAEAHSDRSSAAQIAVFVHESAVHVERAAPIPLSNELTGPVLAEVAACGAPYDVFRLADIPILNQKGVLARYRLAVVANAHAVDTDLRAVIRKVLCRDGRTVVWVGMPGYIEGRHAGADRSTALTGVSVTQIGALWASQVEAFVGGRRYSFGSTRCNDPQLVVDDSEATPIAWFVHGTSRFQPDHARGIALAKKTFSEWTSVVVLVNALPSELLRNLAADAGVHVYSPHGDQVFAGSDWFAVAAKMSGRHVLSAPWAKEPIVLDLKRGECRIVEKRRGE